MKYSRRTLDEGRPFATRLLDAVAKGHLWPAFQPLIDLHTGALLGYEVLARWSDPDIGEIPPNEFIPEAEQAGVIELLRKHIVETACGLAADQPGHFILAFNLSPVEFKNGNLFEDMVRSLGLSGFPAERVHIEVTESALMADGASALSMLEKFKSAGMGVALDDFGKGFASLSRLHAFPFNKLKIDMQFVTNIETDSSSRKIVTSVIGLGQSLGMTVVAEGVETEGQAQILRQLGCDVGQGWLFGKPHRWTSIPLETNRVSGGMSKMRMSPFHRMHQLDELYRTAPVGFCFLDMNLRHISINDHFGRLIGLATDDVIGKSIDEVWPKDEAAVIASALRGVLDEGSEFRIEHDFVGRGTYLITSTLVRDIAGEKMGISATAINITPQKRIEAALRKANDEIERLSSGSRTGGTFTHASTAIRI